jgi:SAM-dependent methyltransferase
MPVLRVLEPSCGDGRILDGIRMRRQSGFGIEYHPGRAAEARAKGHAVLTANFLEHPATPEFDAVVMNPPFYGKHYAQHVRHAYKFLRPGGTLVSILPAAARYDHNELQGEWRDLPVASFAEAGTNVPTTMLKLRKAA